MHMRLYLHNMQHMVTVCGPKTIGGLHATSCPLIILKIPHSFTIVHSTTLDEGSFYCIPNVGGFDQGDVAAIAPEHVSAMTCHGWSLHKKQCKADRSFA